MLHFWDSENVIFNGDEFFEILIDDIRKAQHYITVEMYIFNDDRLGRKIASELVLAHRRGVEVQIIVDGVGSINFFEKLSKVFKKEGMAVKIFNPLPFLHPLYGKPSLVKRFRVLFTRIGKINKRNHRKIITIDEKIMYAGSFNISAEPTRYHPETAWKDMGVRVTGDTVRFAVLNFKRIWRLRDYVRYKKQLKLTNLLFWKSAPLKLNQTIFMKHYYHKDFLRRLQEANEKIWLMTPYFIPRRKLIRVLGNAARRGVDVRILISQKTDISFFTWLQFFYFDYLLRKGVKIFQYTETILHAKNFIIDDYMTIGSTNLNHRSFLHDLEVDLIIQDADNKKRIEEHYLASTISQKTITLEELRHRPLWDRVLSRLFFLFKYWF